MFSVVIPAYNCEKTIYSTLESIAIQTRSDLIEEVIIVNDGSCDSTEMEINRFINEHKNIDIKCVCQKNRGASSARNRGILMAKGEWIALLDADDKWCPQKIEVQYTTLMKIKDCCFLGCARYVQGIVRHTKKGLYKLNAYQLCLKSTPTTPSVVFKKSAGVELGLFDENMKYCEDINFFQRFLKYDSYYVIVDDLLEIGNQKKYFGSSGVSSNITQMAQGRDKNTIDLYKMKLICKPYMYIMLGLNKIKYIRRVILWCCGC